MKIYEADGQFSGGSWGEIAKVNNWLPGYTKSRNCRAVHLPSDLFIRLPTSPLSRMLKCWIWGIALLHYCIKIFANIQLSFLSHIWDVDLAFRALINMRFWVRVGKYQSVKCHASPGSCRGAEQSRAERSSYICSAGAAASSCCISVQTPELGRAGEELSWWWAASHDHTLRPSFAHHELLCWPNLIFSSPKYLVTQSFFVLLSEQRRNCEAEEESFLQEFSNWTIIKGKNLWTCDRQ